jgi:hypothetical protein
MNPLVTNLSFPHKWQARILPTRPLVLPPRHFVYPRYAEEVERGALELMIRADANAPEFLTTCALGFQDTIVPCGIWSCPNPREICAVSGGYAYLIDTTAPERFTMLPYRPVLEVRPVPTMSLLLFVGHHAILAWGADGLAWESEKLSSEGITIISIESATLRGRGWDMLADKETDFSMDLQTGLRIAN